MPLTIAARMKVSVALQMSLLAAAVTGTSLSAQSRPAGLNGNVVDSLGHQIVGASVRLTRQSPDSARDTTPIAVTTSDSLGLFRIGGIAPGPVVLTVEHPSYRRIVAEAALTDGIVVTVRITLLSVEPPAIAAPAATGLRGIVTDTTGAPVADAEVTAIQSDVTVRTDAFGRFTLPIPPNQPTILRARRLGYRAAFLQPLPMQDKELQILLHPLGQQLARVVVRSTWGNSQLEELMRRKKWFGGTHILRDEIERRGPLRVSDLLQGRSGIRVRRDAYGNGVVLGRQDCQMAILVNGVPVRGLSVDDVVSAGDVAAIEAYNGNNTPTELLALGGRGCGALAVWTR